MMTRDSHAWWFVMGGALLLAISSRMDLIDPLLPLQHTKTIHAVIELAAYLVGVSAGLLRMSPLAISPEGRADQVQKNVARAETASTAAAVASVAADTAAKASTVAVEAATVAATESAKAADPVDR